MIVRFKEYCFCDSFEQVIFGYETSINRIPTVIMSLLFSQTSGRIFGLGLRIDSGFRSGSGSCEDFQHPSSDRTRQGLDVLLAQTLSRDRVQDLKNKNKILNLTFYSFILSFFKFGLWGFNNI